MENEIKVGEYVRTKEGYIGKLVEYIPNALNYLKIDVGREIIHCDNSRDNFIYTRYGFQLEHSFNILDILEVRWLNFLWCRYNIYTIIWKQRTNIDYFKCLYKNENLDTIKSIVTKEMMESTSYKVERKD